MTCSIVLPPAPLAPSIEPAGARRGDMAAILAQWQQDLHLAGRVERALTATGYYSLRAIQVTAQTGVVILKGRVPSYYMKQVAQVAALNVAGLQEICNELSVA